MFLNIINVLHIPAFHFGILTHKSYTSNGFVGSIFVEAAIFVEYIQQLVVITYELIWLGGLLTAGENRCETGLFLFGDRDLCQHWFRCGLLPDGTKPLYT